MSQEERTISSQNTPFIGIHRRFEARVARAPDALAVEASGLTLTYRQLDALANRVARRLRWRGARPEAVIGVCLERGPALYATVLGIAKTGAAYAPIDTTHPPPRVARMAADAGMELLVAEPAVVAGLRSGDLPALDPVRLMDERPSDDGADPAPTETPTFPGSLAAVLFTSGSTGQPKPIGITHGGITGLVIGSDYLQVRPDDRVAQVASPSFDVLTFELWSALLNGAALVLVEREELLSPARLRRRIERSGITVLALTSSLLARLVADDPWLMRSPLRTLMFGAEVTDARSIAGILAAGAPERMLHIYGPAECTSFASWYEVREIPRGAATIPIGGPTSGTELHVVDSDLLPVPRGEVGELLIGGDGVTRGYVGRPDATAERFLPNGLGPGAGSRLYRTGDLVRALPGGELEFVGRVDAQVKLGGRRIEPGEIEAALSAHPDVREAAVRLVVDGEDRRLVAYVVAGAGRELDERRLRDALAQTLPPYMVPSAFVPLPALPVSATGKVDRRALPVPPRGSDRPAGPPASTGMERALAAVWREVLVAGTVTADDTFIGLGGHSLAAAQVIGRVRAALGVELPVAALLDPDLTLADLARRLETERPAADAIVPASPGAEGRDRLPLSASQESVWFMNELEGAGPAYHFQSIVEIDGPLDAGRLRRALDAIVRRHEIYRTTFHAEDGAPYQRPHPAAPASLEVSDLTGPPPDGVEERARAAVASEIARRFDVGRLPLVRWNLLRLGEERWWLLHVEHHMVHDGWSWAVFLRDLFALYEADGEDGCLAPLPVQFADYAAWQRRRLLWDDVADARHYWRRRLAGASFALRLPTDRPRSAVRRFRGAAVRTALDERLRRQVESVARRERTTPFVVMLTAFAALLQRWTGDEDLVVGSAVANRTAAEAQDLIGMLVDMLPIRIRSRASSTFAAAVREVHRGVVADLQHGFVPFSSIVAEVRPERDPGRNPLFQAAFSFHDARLPGSVPEGLRARLVEGINNGSAKFDLDVVVAPGRDRRLAPDDDGLTVVWDYDTGLFDEATVARMSRHFAVLLESATGDPELRVSDLPLSPEPERRWLMEAATGPVEAADPAPAHLLVDEWAVCRPELLAVESGVDRLTYGELSSRVGRLAVVLHAAGVRTESPVAVHLDRGPDLVVAILAAMRAGAAVVPLDLERGTERRSALIVRGLDARWVLTGRERLEQAERTGARAVLVDAGPVEDGEARGGPAGVDPEQIAYVIFTSGSTGRPHGVAVPHRALVNHVRGVSAAFGLRPGERVLQFASIAFDAALEEIFATLAAGATLVMLPGGPPAPGELAAWLDRAAIDVLDLPTSYWEEVLRDGGARNLRQDGRPRLVVIGGEALTPGGAIEQQPLLRAGTTVINTYGLTECAITSTLCALAPEDAGLPAAPIGRPIANTCAYVLDDRLRPAPAGAFGQLCIAGAGLARGYWGEPELTAERFVPDPFSVEPGARMYLSGDRARLLPDGRLQFGGRRDRQVKLRGVRVELGEIEAAVAAQPGVAGAVAVLTNARHRDAAIAAYAVAARGAHLDSRGLLDDLRQRLPHYLVPASVQVLDTLPLTDRGKVDVAALPRPAALSPREGAAPGDPVEVALARIWREVLDLEEVAVDDDLFELGGYSLKALQIVSRVREVLGAPISMRTLIEHPTIADLGRAIGRLPGSPAGGGSR